LAEYYFLASLLPELQIGHVPTLGFLEFMQLLKANLNREDYKRVLHFLRLIDLENMRRLFVGEPLDPRGNLNEEQLKEALDERQFSNSEPFPEFFYHFLEKHKTSEERAKEFPFVMGRYLQEETEEETGFLRDYFEFERYMRIVITGFRAKKLHKNVEKELQFEDSSDPIVAQVIAQKDAKSFEPPFEFKELKPLFEAYGDQPLELHKALTQYRFNRVVEMTGGEHFSIDRILGYLARLLLVEKWLELDYESGMRIIETIERRVE
jgi:hypothetical protein